MNDSDLDNLLKAAPPPGRAPEFWEQLPRRITARLHWQEKRRATVPGEPRRLAPLAWALGSALACVSIALAVLALHHLTHPAPDQGLARADKYYHELESLFPNQVQAIVFDKHGPRLVLAPKADVPPSPPLYLKICGPRGCQEFITFSGQQIRVNGDNCDVLADGNGHILLVSKQLVWSSASRSPGVGPYRVEAQPLEKS